MLCHAVNVMHGPFGEHVGQITFFVVLCFIGKQIVIAARIAMGKVICTARHVAKKFFITALQWAKSGRKTQMPFAHQGRAVTTVAQQGRQGGVPGGQAHGGAAPVFAGNRFLGRAAQAVLVTRRHQGKTRGRADRRVGIPLGQFQPIGGQAVQHRRAGQATTVTTQVGVTQVVGHNKNDVRAGRVLSGHGGLVKFRWRQNLWP